ncbi:hypothetical protein LMG24238_05354 [Paraburkholderia sediminicola]|uniref:Uncharacterized protein n=1 Tax=Paraburkholderia sediminicola TaxID=458836 RepID=A0A6J5C445_9BURK|nr:hypothetical protein LMG24238_05354 [Paraburkholderia sediminicola]
MQLTYVTLVTLVAHVTHVTRDEGRANKTRHSSRYGFATA